MKMDPISKQSVDSVQLPSKYKLVTFFVAVVKHHIWKKEFTLVSSYRVLLSLMEAAIRP